MFIWHVILCTLNAIFVSIIFPIIFSMIYFDGLQGKKILFFFIYLPLAYYTFAYLIWNLLGGEVVTIGKTHITLQRVLIWRFKTRRFLISDIENMKVELHIYGPFIKLIPSMRTRIFGKQSMRFEHNSKIIRFGRGLSEEDTTALLVLLKTELDRPIIKSKKRQLN